MMDWSDIATFLLRGMHIAAALSLFGCLIFAHFVLPASMQGVSGVVVSRIGLSSAWLALAFGGGWLAAVSGTIAHATGLASLGGAVLAVASHTTFGNLLCLRLLLLAGVVPLLWRRTPRLLTGAMILAGTALALQPLSGHIGALQGGARAVLIPIEIAHLLAAARVVWRAAATAVLRLAHAGAAGRIVMRTIYAIGLSRLERSRSWHCRKRAK